MDNSNQPTEEHLIALKQKYALESEQRHQAIKDVLSLPGTPVEELIKIGESIPWLNLEELAPLLVSHPNFTDATLEALVKHLKIQWWGDDPIECRIGWETLEHERAAYLKKVENISDSL